MYRKHSSEMNVAEFLVHVQHELPIRQFIQDSNHIYVIYVANLSVTRNDVADHLRIHIAVKTCTCREYSKIYQLFDRQKIQTGGKLHKCFRCGKDLILCSGLTPSLNFFVFVFFNILMVFAVHQHE